MQTYGPIKLTFPDRKDWSRSNILGIQAKKYGDKTFLTEPGRGAFTYRQMDESATRVAGGLIARGFQLGDRMMIYMDNRNEYIHAWFGATRAGVVEVPTNTGYFGDFLKHALNVTKPHGVAVGSNYVR